MRAILINPVDRSVTEVEYDDNNALDSIYGHIQADCFTVVTLNSERDGIYLDDEGLFKDELYAFTIAGYPQPLVGRGLILGCDDEGGSIEPSVTVEQVLRAVNFMGQVYHR